MWHFFEYSRELRKGHKEPGVKVKWLQKVFEVSDPPLPWALFHS